MKYEQLWISNNSTYGSSTKWKDKISKDVRYPSDIVFYNSSGLYTMLIGTICNIRNVYIAQSISIITVINIIS